MKLTGIVTIGTYFSPWFGPGLASFYFVDEIIVVNGGYSLKSPRIDEYNIPLEQVSKEISRLDVEGKVFEWTGWDLGDLKHKLVLSTEKDHPNVPFWGDMRAVGLTLALEKAVERGADFILKWDSDQCGFRDCIAFKNNLRSVTFHQVEFVGDKFYIADPPPDSPYNDSVYSFRASRQDFFGGGGVPALSSVMRNPRESTEEYRCAHLRYANPPSFSKEEQFKHLYGRCWFSKFTNEGLRGKELEERARQTALDLLTRKTKLTGSPPEVCLMDDPLKYIEENFE